MAFLTLKVSRKYQQNILHFLINKTTQTNSKHKQIRERLPKYKRQGAKQLNTARTTRTKKEKG